MTAVISWSCQVTDWYTLLLIGGRILFLVQKWMIACNYSMTMLQLHSNKWWISSYWTVKLGKGIQKNKYYVLTLLHPFKFTGSFKPPHGHYYYNKKTQSTKDSKPVTEDKSAIVLVHEWFSSGLSFLTTYSIVKTSVRGYIQLSGHRIIIQNINQCPL